MKAQELSHKYATAVFSQALERWITTLRMVDNRLKNDAALTAMLQDTTRSFAERRQALDPLLAQESDAHIRNFLYTMLRDGDILLLAEVIGELDRMMGGGPQVRTARVVTAIALSDSDKEQFRQKLQQKYGSDLEFMFVVDPAIVGGAIVQIGDKVIDGSIATRLESMSNFLGIRS